MCTVGAAGGETALEELGTLWLVANGLDSRSPLVFKPVGLGPLGTKGTASGASLSGAGVVPGLLGTGRGSFLVLLLLLAALHVTQPGNLDGARHLGLGSQGSL